MSDPGATPAICPTCGSPVMVASSEEGTGYHVPSEWTRLVRSGAVVAVREVIAAYEAVTRTHDWVSLSPAIVKLRAHVWRLDGVITEADDAEAWPR